MDIAELSDRTEINDALVRYTIAVDTGEWDRLDTVFTPDAQIDHGETGGAVGTYPDVKAWLAGRLPAASARRMHTLGQVAISFANTRDEARVTAYFHRAMVVADPAAGPAAERLVEVGGLYHHTFVRTPAGWRSRRLHEQRVWTRGS